MNKNEEVIVDITDLGMDGEGIGKVDGYTLFVKDACIGDQVLAGITKAKKNYAFARLIKVLKPSPFRVEEKCPIAKRCGGCQIQCISYDKQLEFKQNKVRNDLIRIGGFDEAFVDSHMEKICAMTDANGEMAPFRYRNKAQYPISRDKNGKIIAGFYAGRTHSVIENDDCLLGTQENHQILDIIIEYMNKAHIAPYDEQTGKGVVRHVLIRKGFESGQIMVCLVVTDTKKLTNVDKLIDKLSKIPGMTSISADINNQNTNVIMGPLVKLLWGEPTIKDTLCGIEFNISPLSFYQVNPIQAQRLYEQAIEYAGLTGKETVWDLYCGIGTISLAMSKKAGEVYGVEIIPDAIEDAKKNATNNGITNAHFMCGKAEEVLPREYEENGIKADVIVVDPPRKGCDEACLETMLKIAPDRIVYVSCDPATLSRDLRILVDGGYQIEKVRPFDMFPQTVHVETVVLLTKQNT